MNQEDIIKQTTGRTIKEVRNEIILWHDTKGLIMKTNDDNRRMALIDAFIEEKIKVPRGNTAIEVRAAIAVIFFEVLRGVEPIPTLVLA